LSVRFGDLGIENCKEWALVHGQCKHSGGTAFSAPPILPTHSTDIVLFHGVAKMKVLKFLKKISYKYRWFGALATSLSWAVSYIDHAWQLIRHFLA
jgi:hypothetical protein